jgi:Tfp pilus assembly protein PilN
MFELDLLTGDGIPVRTGPERIVVGVVAIAVPLVIAALMVGAYLSNRIVISVAKAQMAKYQTMPPELTDAAKAQTKFVQEKNAINGCLKEVSTVIDRHAQWSPILAAIDADIPRSVVLTRLEVKQEQVKTKAPSKDDPRKVVDVTVPQRILSMTLCGRFGCEQQVRDFREWLYSHELLAPRLEDIKQGQRIENLDGENLIAFDMDCIFKPGL